MGSLDCNLVDSIFMSMYGSYRNTTSEKLAQVLGYSRTIRDVSITNLTKLDIKNQYGSYAISDFIFVPPIISYGKRLIGIATLKDEMKKEMEQRKEIK